jgi:hypothetical protein
VEGRCALTFTIDGVTEDEIRAAALDLKRSFNAAAVKRYPGYRPGIFTFNVSGEPPSEQRADAGGNDDPERLFD